MSELNRVLVTGASGFVGRTLCPLLVRAGYPVRAATRRPDGTAPLGVEGVTVGDISGATQWQSALVGVASVIHAAARAHVLGDAASNARLYHVTNTEGTANLAAAAARAGVRRFIYLSTIKVNGEQTHSNPFTAADDPQPADPYGTSKRLAEQSLWEIARQTGMEVAIIRPPLVYGPGVRANFLRLLRWVDRQLPLPLGSVDNRRSLVNIWNLCDLLINTLENPAATGTWMVSDGEDLSTPQLIHRIGVAMNRRARIFPAPVAMLRAIAALLGRAEELRRLEGSLVVDISHTRAALGWSPPLSVDEGLARTVEWYLSVQQRLGSA